MLLEITSLKKSYSSGFEVGPINLKIKKGEVLGLLGPNGAGKSTLYQIISGNMDATEGEVHMNGNRIRPEKSDLKKRIGYLPQHLALPKWVTPKDILKYAANLYGDISKEKIQEKLSFFSCTDYENRPLQACSHGMQKRAGLALSTLHEPELLILDEPFSGLDIIQTKALENHIADRKNRGLATILSTHIPPYVAKICDHCVILSEGNIHTLDQFPNANYLDRIEMIESQFFPTS